MSSEEERIRRSKRRHKARMKMIKQYKIAKDYDVLPTGYEDNIHIFHKHNALNCGNSNCPMCGNPRKFFGEVTRQEQIADEMFEDYLEEFVFEDPNEQDKE